MRILDAEGSVVHDTYIENLAVSLVRSSIDASHAIVTGAIGLTLLIKGLHPIWKHYTSNHTIYTETVEDSNKKKTIRQRILTLWGFLKTLLSASDSDVPLMYCLWCGSFVGLGIKITNH